LPIGKRLLIVFVGINMKLPTLQICGIVLEKITDFFLTNLPYIFEPNFSGTHCNNLLIGPLSYLNTLTNKYSDNHGLIKILDCRGQRIKLGI